MEKFDLVVIGSGPGGYVAAIRAAQLGLKTAVVEKAELGGICLNWGCIPTKALLHSATLLNHIRHAADFGILAADPEVDFSRVIKHSRSVASRLSKGIEFLFRKNKIAVLAGTALITAPGKIKVTAADQSEQTIETKDMIIATGARARAIPGVTFDGEQIISSREAMVLDKLPTSLIIIGAGAIGVEFAYFFATLGTKVTLVEMLPHILPIEDAEAVEVVAKAFKKMGITILTGTRVEQVEKGGASVRIHTSGGAGNQILEGEKALVAIGVQGNVENLGLEALGVKIDRGHIVVDKKNYRTHVNGIYAIGDVIGPPWLAHVASAEGIAAAEGIAGHPVTPVDYENIPGCTYCQPQVASVGLTEEKAREQGLDIKIGRFPIRANGKSMAMGETEGFAKLIFDARYGELIGAHLVGAEATELLAELNLGKTLETTADEIMHTMHAHPTISEIIKEAAEDAYGHAIHI
ncbi:MAG TPA: dihydrolipoyl dehydrogenase [bacterium]|nr:dihydrolipoyl dehydrogenase [bacterium]HQJ64794.1 dihydrolipoyl dehydrogenase [bacterium]